MDLRGMIFAAGIGSRLAPLTDHTPKALMEVGGKPMLQRTIERLMRTGIRKIVINVHHHADKIRHFLADNDNFGAEITISDETESLLDTGGALIKAHTLLNGADCVVLHNADIFTDIPLHQLIESHLECGADVSLALKDRPTSRYLLFDETIRMRGWLNAKTGEVLPPGRDSYTLHPGAFCGIHVINPHTLFPMLRQYSQAVGNDKFSLTPFYAAVCDSVDIRGHEMNRDAVWVDIGTHESLAKARAIADHTY